MLHDHFGDVVTLESAQLIAIHFRDLGTSLNDVELKIYDYDDNYADFIRELGIELVASADSLFIELDFVKTVADHMICFKWISADYTIEIEFDMANKKVLHNQYYRGGIVSDYYTDPITIVAITRFMIENDFIDLEDIKSGKFK